MSWRVEPLRPEHRHVDFTCGTEWLDRYLRQHAARNQARGYGKTYVYVPDDDARRVDGYYTVSMSSVQFENLPPPLRFSNMPKYPMPAAHMGCFAIANALQRQGHGRVLFIDALRRMVAGAEIVAARAVEVKAFDEAAKAYWTTYGFQSFTDLGSPPFHMFLPMATAEQIVLASG